MKNGIDIVTVGAILKETICFPDREIGPVIGSPTAYFGLVMAAQGLRVGIVTHYGNDMEDIISELDVLDKRGVMHHEHTTANLLIYREDGTKYVEYTKTAPNITFDKIHPDYLSSDYFVVCPMNYEVEVEVVEKLCSMGKTVLVDLGGYGGATSDIRHSILTDYGNEVISRLCKSGSIIKASMEDLASIIPDKTAEEAADYLTQAGARKVIVTLGSGGAMFRCNHDPLTYVEPIEAISETLDGEIDCTGAGDSFGAGFMVSYVEHRDMRAAVLNGNVTASLLIQRSGGCTLARMPNKERIKQRLQSRQHRTIQNATNKNI